MAKAKAPTEVALRQIGVDLAVLKNKAAWLGLYRTMHAIDDATKVYTDDAQSPERKKMGFVTFTPRRK